MSYEKAKKVLKRFGIICLIIGAFLTVMGIILFVGAGVAFSDAARAENAPGFISGGIVNLIIGLDALIEGIICMVASKDGSKTGLVLFFAVIGIVFSALSVLSGVMKGDVSGISSGIVSLVVNGLLFYTANIVKKGAKAEKAQKASGADNN
ncbi:MAG: hypothetical protein IK139_05755 [Lachnospiraceae bacterium]|nr:hypothetical protein [Lachnospiraceae bacterium]